MTRALVVTDISHLQDVNNYEAWSHFLTAHRAMPGGESWQYPPGAAWLMLAPRLWPGGYGGAFVGLMLVFDLSALGLLALLGRRGGSYRGVWVWLLAMPLLGTFSLLRFDLVPTAIAIAALLVIQRRPGWFGALAGLGAAIKVWPIVLLFGEWERRRLLVAAAWWWLRAMAIRQGQVQLAKASVSRDFVFTVVLLLVVTSRVLSAQYMVWLLGLAAVVLSASDTRLSRPAWTVVAAAALTTFLFKSPATIAARDLLLLAATIDASVAIVALLRQPSHLVDRLLDCPEKGYFVPLESESTDSL